MATALVSLLVPDHVRGNRRRADTTSQPGPARCLLAVVQLGWHHGPGHRRVGRPGSEARPGGGQMGSGWASVLNT